MDLVASGSRVIVTMEHNDKKGGPKLLPRCTLPLTGARVVSSIITEKGLFEVLPQNDALTELNLSANAIGSRCASAPNVCMCIMYNVRPQVRFAE